MIVAPKTKPPDKADTPTTAEMDAAPGGGNDALENRNATTPIQMGGGGTDPGVYDDAGNSVDDTIRKMMMIQDLGTPSRLWEELLRRNEYETMHGELHLPELFEGDDDDDDLGRRRFF